MRGTAKLEAALPVAELVDAGEATMRMRMIKSAEEHALIRDGAAIADIGGAAGVEAIADRAPEHEVALHATGAMVREIARRYPHVELMDTSRIRARHAPGNNATLNNIALAIVFHRGFHHLPDAQMHFMMRPMIAGYYHALERTLPYRHVPTSNSRPGR